MNYNLYPEGWNKIKREIKASCTTLGLPLLVMFFISRYIYYLITYTAYMLKLDIFDQAGYVTNELAIEVISLIGYTVVMAVPIILGQIFCKTRISFKTIFQPPAAKLTFIFVLAYFGLSALDGIVTSYITAFFNNFGISPSSYATNIPSDPAALIVYMISTCIFPAFLEELLFRGVILGGLKKFGAQTALIVSSLLFGLSHGNFEQFIYAFILGIILGFIAIKTNSIWCCILVHFLNNTYATVMEILSEHITDDLFTVISSCIFIAEIALAIIAAIIYFRFYDLRLEKFRDNIPSSKKIIWSLTSLGCILNIIFFAGQILSGFTAV